MHNFFLGSHYHCLTQTSSSEQLVVRGLAQSLAEDQLPSSPSEDYLTALAGQRQWIATTNCAGCPGQPPDSFANSAVLTTLGKSS